MSLTEERIAVLREAFKYRGQNTDAALDQLIRTAAKESAEAQISKDAEIAFPKCGSPFGMLDDCRLKVRNTILAQLPTPNEAS